ncbi:Myb-like dna-binding, partial [Globisporangium splendens]
MITTSHVQSQYFVNDAQIIRLPPSSQQPEKKTKRSGRPWTAEEHNRFLEAMQRFPSGPWKIIASCVGTRTTRQTMTHAQRYREKIARRKRTLADVVQLGYDPAIQATSSNELSTTGLDGFNSNTEVEAGVDLVHFSRSQRWWNKQLLHSLVQD